MEFPRLVSLPTELLHYLCLFLSEIDIFSLFQTCLRLYEALNANRIWKRFITEEMRRLESQNQQLNPPFQVDPSLCENLQHLLRRDHLLSNWRNGTITLFGTNHGIENINATFSRWHCPEVCKENYLFAENGGVDHFWNISRSPFLCHTMLLTDGRQVGDYLVVAGNHSRVGVYKINVDEWTFPLLYSFAVEEDTIANEIVIRDQVMCCKRWNCGGAGNYLVFSQKHDMRFPLIHIWDVVNARKVGAFTSPVRCFYVTFRCLENNCLFLTTERGGDEMYLKFDLTTRRFSESVFRARDEYDTSHAMFYQDHCIVMKRNVRWEGSSLVCEVFEFNTSVKVKERLFGKAEYCLQHKQIVDGKLVIFTSESFHVIDALTLNTVVIVPHGPDVRAIMSQTSVFRSIFLVAVESDGAVKIWDLEKETSTLLPVKNFSKTMVNYICRGLKKTWIVKGIEPLTKFVIFGEEKIYVAHFW